MSKPKRYLKVMKINFSFQLFKGGLRVKKQNNDYLFKVYIISGVFVVVQLPLLSAIVKN